MQLSVATADLTFEGEHVSFWLIWLILRVRNVQVCASGYNFVSYLSWTENRPIRKFEKLFSLLDTQMDDQQRKMRNLRDQTFFVDVVISI